MRLLRCLILAVFTFSYSIASAKMLEVGGLYESWGQPTQAQTETVSKTITEKVKKKWKALKVSIKSFWNDKEAKQDPNTTNVAEQQAVAKPVLSEKQKAIASLPSFTNPEKAQVGEVAKELSQSIKNKDLFDVVTPGREGKSLPAFNAKKISEVDLGLEPELEPNSFNLSKYKVFLQELSDVKALPSPERLKKQEFAQWNKLKPNSSKLRELRGKKWQMAQPVTRERLAKLMPKINPVQEDLQELAYQPLTKEERLLLTVQILDEKNKYCSTLLGLGSELIRKTSHKDYGHFVVGKCAAQGKLHSEAVAHLLPLIKAQHAEYAKTAITDLVVDLPEEYYSKVAPVLKGVFDTDLVQESHKSEVSYIIARDGYTKGQNTRAYNFAAQVAKASPLYLKAQYIMAIVHFNKKEVTKAKQELLAIRSHMTKSGKTDKNIGSLVSLTLARIYFHQKKFKQAYDEYQLIDKSHPSWIQAVIELGWAQLALGDPSGAIGNMYSVQSPYFKSVYKPESYVVRAIGYLNICQYGDAYRTITQLEGIHKNWLGKVDKYLKTKKSSKQVYATTFQYLSGKSSQQVAGLPHQVIREIARQKNFLNEQDSINQKYDELSRYKGELKKISKKIGSANWKRNNAKQRLSALTLNLKKAKKDKGLAKMVNEWRAKKRTEKKLIAGLGYEIQVLKQGKKQFRKMRIGGKRRFNAEMSVLKTRAGKALRANLRTIKKDIAGMIENNEFLRYEVYAGSGENIRYQVSGGKSTEANRIPAHVKPKKILAWEFDGEYWEDEIGSYRSSLKNNCPNYKQAQFGGGQ